MLKTTVCFQIFMFMGAKRRVVQSVYEKWNRPGPFRSVSCCSVPTRPAISATRLPALKMADLGPPVFAICFSLQ